jgi:hypothetical protein
MNVLVSSVASAPLPASFGDWAAFFNILFCLRTKENEGTPLFCYYPLKWMAGGLICGTLIRCPEDACSFPIF